MSEEDRKLQKHLVDEMMKVSKTNPDVMFYMEALMKKYEDLQQKVEQLEKENEYLKMSNPEQNMEHFRIVNENKRKIDMLRKENHQLENIRKEAIEYLKKREYDNYSCSVCSVMNDDLLNILNKGSVKE